MKRKIIYRLIYMYYKKTLRNEFDYGGLVVACVGDADVAGADWSSGTRRQRLLVGARRCVRQLGSNLQYPAEPRTGNYFVYVSLEAPKLQTSCLRYFSPSVLLVFSFLCRPSFCEHGDRLVSLVLFFTPSYIGFVNRRTRVKFATPLFFSGSQVNDVTLRIFRPPPGVVTCFYCD